MTDSQINEDRINPGKPRARSVILFLLVAFIFGLVMRDAALAAEEAEATVENQLQAAGHSTRKKAAYALVKKARKAEKPAKKIRLYDEIIETYREDTTMPIPRYVSWALYKKAVMTEDVSEKSRLHESVIDKYCDATDKAMNRRVRKSLRTMLSLANSGAEKIAYCDRILETYDSRLPDSLAAMLLSEKAGFTRETDEQTAVYDTLLSRFLSSADDTAFDYAVNAAMDKMKLISDKDEQIRLCDIAIDAFLQTPGRTRYYLFKEAAVKKAQLINDPSLLLTLCNQVIENNLTEASVVQARSMRMQFLKNDSERLAACDEFINVHQVSKTDFVQLMVVRAMLQKARLITDRDEKTALLRSVIEKSKDVEDKRAKGTANTAVEMLATLIGDQSIAARHYEEIAATSENRLDAARALARKAEMAKDGAEKLRLMEEIVAMLGDSNKVMELLEATTVYLKMSRLVADEAEKIGLYDKIIAIGEINRDHRLRKRSSEAMLQKARLIGDKKAKILLYDDIIARGMDGGDKEWLESAAQAMLEKAEHIDDKEEKIRLYDTVLFGMRQFAGRYFVSSALKKRIALAAEPDDKLQLYDRYLATAGADISQDSRMSLLLEKAAILEAPADKSRLYDEIIEFCENYLDRGEYIGNSPYLREYARKIILDKFGRAVLGKAGLLEKREDKINLYERFLAFPQQSPVAFPNTPYAEVLSRRVEMAGDLTGRRTYFAEKIRNAVTDSERLGWHVQKAKMEGAAISADIIDQFFENTDKDVERLIAGELLGKIRRTSDTDERDKLCNRLIERYQDSEDEWVVRYVIDAFAVTAMAAKDDSTKIRIYGIAIDRYKGVDKLLVKMSIDRLIAAKSELEAKKGK